MTSKFIWQGSVYAVRVNNDMYSAGLLGADGRLHHHITGPENEVYENVAQALQHITLGCALVTNARYLFLEFGDRRPLTYDSLSSGARSETTAESVSPDVLLAFMQMAKTDPGRKEPRS